MREKLEIAFRLLLNTQKQIVSSLKDTVLKEFDTLPPEEQEKLEINIEICSLFIITICLKDNFTKQKFHEYYTDHSGKDVNYLESLYKEIERLFPKYYEAYDHFYNKRYPIFGNYLYQLVFKSNFESIIPLGSAGFSSLLVMNFSFNISTVMQLIESIKEEYDFEI